MKIYKFLPFALLILSLIPHPLPLAAAEEVKYQPSGPLNIRNQTPLYLFYMAPFPDRAETLAKGKVRIDTSYHVSNVAIHQRPWPAQQFGGTTEKDREWWVYVDTEINRLDLNISYGVLERLELNIDIPYYVFSDGYLDGFIENFEDTFSFIKTPNAREETGRYNYEYEIRNRGRPIILSESEPNDFGEASAYLKYKVLDESKWMPAVSLRGAVKFPTTKDNLLGSKKFDYGLGFLFDKNLFKRLFIYSNLNVVFINKPELLDNLEIFDYMIHGIIGLEYFLTNKTSMLFQATANTTIYDGGVPSTGHDPVVLTLGFNHNFNDRVCWQIAMNENTNSAAPDFGIFTSIKYKL